MLNELVGFLQRYCRLLRWFLQKQRQSERILKTGILYELFSQILLGYFVLFVNKPKYAHFSYLRYIENRLRESFNLDGTPIELVLRERV